MGAVIRRTSVLLALLALLVPSVGQASTTTYERPFANGPAGGDSFNHVERDGSTGEMSIIRFNPTPANGGLGCGGSGGWTNFEIAHTADAAITSVSVDYSSAVIDPYSFMKVSLYQDGHFVDTVNLRGPVLGDGTLTLTPNDAATGDVTIWIGLQMSSACPNIGIARVTFDSVTVTEA